MAHPRKKLTMVSVVIDGRRTTVFTTGKLHDNGKTTVPSSVINSLTKHLPRGHTYSIGA